ncbi:hypothetical protein [Variovorax sp. Sphag1AA]|uniref:hypothetical protein n=1 Tax=Variovorax sp. Sphag1AA TaxID=2587027 RepID=UPI00161155AE|nr:hypothetical protein [Variovorax sp. Sphag1AA]MBB3176343.1 hypothetical protein [Variovorax sp. Sphag1AA]
MTDLNIMLERMGALLIAGDYLKDLVRVIRQRPGRMNAPLRRILAELEFALANFPTQEDLRSLVAVADDPEEVTASNGQAVPDASMQGKVAKLEKDVAEIRLHIASLDEAFNLLAWDGRRYQSQIEGLLEEIDALAEKIPCESSAVAAIGEVAVPQPQDGSTVGLEVREDIGPEPRREGQDPLRALVRDGVLLEASEFIKATSLTKRALSGAVRARRLFAVELDDDKFYPAFYADASLDRKKLGAVCRILGDLSGAYKMYFFQRRWPSLAGRSPLEALKEGALRQVRSAARHFHAQLTCP